MVWDYRPWTPRLRQADLRRPFLSSKRRQPSTRVGYNATAKTINLLFWNGQAFDEAGLKPVGKYRAAQAMFGDAAEIDPKVIRRWLKKASADVFDSIAFFRKLREGKKEKAE